MEDEQSNSDHDNNLDDKEHNMNEGGNFLEQVSGIAPEVENLAPSSNKDKPIFRSLFSDATETWIRDQSSRGEHHLQQPEEGQRESPSLQKNSYAEDSSEETEESSSYSSASYDNVEEEEEENENEEDEDVDYIDSCMHDNAFTEEGSDIWTDDDGDSDEENSIDSSNSIRSKSNREVEVVVLSPVVESNEPPNSTTTTSTKNMRGMLSARNSFDDTSNSFWTNSASDTNSDSQIKSVEFGMVVDLRTSWTTVKESPSQSQSQSQSQSSSSFSTLGGSLDVFVHDDKLCWLPARVLEHQHDHALVAISLPETWYDSTVVEEGVQLGNGMHSSIKKMAPSEVDMLVSEFGIPVNMLRKISYSDYDMGELPRQNIQTAGKHDVATSVNKAPSDLADLRELHMATILFNLKERHFFQKPYTRVGDILIAMNPFVWIDKLYTPENRDTYSHHLIWNYVDNQREQVKSSNLEEQRSNIYDRLGFDPHVYEISSLAYRDLATTGNDQTILVTGESGAGKTETVKILMDHLASAQFSRPIEDDDQPNNSNDIVARVIKSSPVFEAFGNAKTARNNNSSRFGKFVRLQFRVEPQAEGNIGDRDVPYADLVGSTVSTYLLEKNRVVFHAEGERTFHIFYQLLAAPSDFKQQLWPSFGQASADDFLYTVGSTSTCIDHDHGLWTKTQNALELFKFRNESLIVLMQALGIVLQLGNLVFEHDSTSQHEHSSLISNQDDLNRLSEMIGISSNDLRETMTSRTLDAPGAESIRVSLTPEAAKEACDALAKEIYSRIFDVIVKRVNEYTLERKESQGNSLFGQISLLDIFGFEHFEVNRFEQLCINYCNEKLQSKYVVDNFNKIKSQYIEEGVDLYDFKLVDNSEILDLLEGRNGLITILNEECLRPKGNDESFVYKAKRAHSGSTSKLISEKLHRRTEFGVNHFAGCVRYDAHSFVLGNMEKLPTGLIECAAKSTNSLIQDEFRKLEAGGGNHSVESKLPTRRKKGANKTVLNKFQRQLNSLMSAIEGTRTRYIRCIKPNRSMVPKMTDHVSTMRQLECSGLMTVLIVSRESYPQNLEYQFIMSRYRCLAPVDEEITADIEPKEKVRNMLTRWLKHMSKKNRYGSRTMPFACGKSKVFFKAGAQDRLEYLRRQLYERSARTIQCLFRTFAAVRLSSLKNEAVHKIQSFSRMVLVKTRFHRQRLSATAISAWIRCRFSVNMLRMKRENMVLIQASYRQWKYHRMFLRMKEKAIVTQSVIRMALVRTRLQRRHNAVTRISSWLRSCWCKFLFERVLAARKLQPVMRCFVNRMKVLRVINAATLIQKVANVYISRKVAYAKSQIHQQLREKKREIEGSFEIASSACKYTETMYKAVGEEMMEGNADISSPANAASEEMVKNLKARIEELTKTNGGLVKEVFKLRHEKVRMHKQHQSATLQMSSKLSAVEDELESTRRKYEKKKEKIERQNFENDKFLADREREIKHKTALLKEKHSTKLKMLSDELCKTQECHQQYLNKLVDVLETTHSMREEETAKMSKELCAIKKEKNNQIILLHKEVKALRSITGRTKESRSLPYAEAQARKNDILHNIDEDARNLQRFEEVAKDLVNLIVVNLIARSSNAQHMTEMIGFLQRMYKNSAESLTLKNKRSLGTIYDHIAVSERFETITDLKERIMQTEFQRERLREKLRKKKTCDRCAAIV